MAGPSTDRERNAKPEVATQLRTATPLIRHTARRLSH